MRVTDYIDRLRASIPSESPLATALRWWSAQDDYGGFQSIARVFFDYLWVPGRSVHAPHRRDRRKSFSVFFGQDGRWRFKDHATDQKGTLVDFVMLTGKSQLQACRWLMEHGDTRPDENPISSELQAREEWKPYKLTFEEIQWQGERATELWYNKEACCAIAAARGWQVETIEVLAGQRYLGIDGPRLFYLYTTGYKERLRPLDKRRLRAFPPDEIPFRNSSRCLDSMWREDIATSAEVVNVTEGETDCISGFDTGIEGAWLALPNCTTWRPTWADTFAGKAVVLWPDGDKPGFRCAENFLKRVQKPGTVLSVDIREKTWTS